MCSSHVLEHEADSLSQSSARDLLDRSHAYTEQIMGVG